MITCTVLAVAIALSGVAPGAAPTRGEPGIPTGPEQITITDSSWFSGALHCVRLLWSEPTGSQCAIVVVPTGDPRDQDVLIVPLPGNDPQTSDTQTSDPGSSDLQASGPVGGDPAGGAIA